MWVNIWMEVLYYINSNLSCVSARALFPEEESQRL
jgi:hypothetical protein